MEGRGVKSEIGRKEPSEFRNFSLCNVVQKNSMSCNGSAHYITNERRLDTISNILYSNGHTEGEIKVLTLAASLFSALIFFSPLPNLNLV